MVLIIDGQEVTSSISVSSLHDTFQLLKANSISLLSRPVRLVSADERCLYVGQREMAVAACDDNMDMLGSEDATTCHIVILRDVTTEAHVTGVAHIDSDEPEQFLALERAVRDRNGVRSVTRELDALEYDVSIFGGYDDDNRTSEDITETLLSVMQALNARFRLQIACIGSVNTLVKNNVAWPRVYGAGVSLDTGQVFSAQFSYHGPDTDIRSLRLNSGGRNLNNIYDPHSGQIVLHPFTYRVIPDAHLWLRKADSFILKYCSTSPKVEPPDFCENMRSKFRRMISDPKPMDTIFPGGRPRLYTRNAITGQWILEMVGDEPSEDPNSNSLWSSADLRIQFN